MKKFNLSFLRDDIYERLADGMAFAGVRGQGSGANPERIGISRRDRTLLDGYFDEAVGGLLGEVKCFLSGVQNSLTKLELRFSMPDTYDETLTDGIGESIKGYLLSFLAWRWKETVLPAEAQKARDFALDSLEEAVSGLCFRRAPSRPSRKNSTN